MTSSRGKKGVKKRPAKAILAWGGFTDGKLDWYVADAAFAWAARLPAIYKTRAEARKNYQDYRRVKITVQP